MKSALPDINLRSHTPSNAKFTDRKIRPPLAPAPIKSVRNISVGPMSTRSSRHDSSDLFTSFRPVSDESQMVQLERVSFLSRLNTTFARTKISKITTKVPVFTNYAQVISALFSIYNCEKQRIQGNHLISLFQGIGFCDGPEVLIDIIQGISEGLSINMIFYSKQDLIKLCEDAKTENLLRILVKDTISNGFFKEKSVDGPVNTIKKWWDRVDKAHNGAVPVDEIVKFLSDIGVIQSSSDIKRMFLKMSQLGTFKQFFSIFSKSLLKFLLQEIGKIIAEPGVQFVSPELTIMALRRKVLLENLNGDGKAFGL